MCSLSQGIKEKAIAIGEEIGESRGKRIGEEIGEAKREKEIIQKMHETGFTSEQIASVTEKKVEEVEAILKGA